MPSELDPNQQKVTPAGPPGSRGLDGPQRARLRQALLEAFPTWDDLALLVSDKLSVALGTVVSEKSNLTFAAAGLLEWANADVPGRLVLLVEGAANSRPQSEEWKELLVLVRQRALEPGRAAPQDRPRRDDSPRDRLRKAVRAFDEQFNRRKDLFGYLNGNKKLHDVLHRLQSYSPRLRIAVAARLADPAEPTLDDAAADLAEYLEDARSAVPRTEFPDNPPEWIAQFAKALEALAGPAERLSGAEARLANLPDRYLTRLNEKLIDCARRLDAVELVQLLDDIRAQVGPELAGAEMDVLRREAGNSRGLCGQLVELIGAHDLCQKVDDALHEGLGSPQVQVASLTDWEDVKAWLAELARVRPTDRRVERTVRMAEAFAAAVGSAAPAAFARLIEKFRDLFLATDTALLEVTNQLPTAGLNLNLALEPFR